MNFSAERAGNAMVVNAMFAGGARDEENLVSCALALRAIDREEKGWGLGRLSKPSAWLVWRSRSATPD